jgi:hypothetical protein
MRFLEEIAEHVINKYQGSTDTVTVVFPNRRAGLFFRKYLSDAISKPIWSPKILSIEDFIKGLSTLETADRLDLIFELYKVFQSLNKSREAFEKFFFWGNILLQDFDEIDKFLVDARLLFKNLVHIKQLENSLDYLDEDQKELILGFWKSFGDKLSKQQKGFLGVWDNMLQTYVQFKARLAERNMAYDGMIYRKVCEDLHQANLQLTEGTVIFAGFNALSKSEEAIISWFVGEGRGEVFWDADDYYLDDTKQEAGKYLREMKSGKTPLNQTFKKSYGNAFQDSEKHIEVISAASEVGQAQEASAILSAICDSIDERTAVVLPNNTLLFPLLHAVPAKVEKLNITMGYPLSSSTFYGLLEATISLQVRAEGKSVYHYRSVLSILKHPALVRHHDEEIRQIISDIQQQNLLWISRNKLNTGHLLLSLIFKSPESDMSEYLNDIIRFIAGQSDDAVEKEFAFRFYQIFNRLKEFLHRNQMQMSIQAMQKIFRQLAQTERLPFEGEPLLGLQVMGILETRNLDFENIIVLSMNEGLIPPAPKNTSFVPYSIRKVFGLPVTDHQDAMFAYIFYRLVQRAKNIHFIYNSTEGTGKSGEVSRFVRQLEHESNIKITHRTVANEVLLEDPNVISVNKTQEIMDRLFKFTSKQNFRKRFTPTAINTYLDCQLKFHFKYVMELYEQDEMAEEVDAMVFGNIMHKVMERLYQPYDADGQRTITKNTIENIKHRVDVAIKQSFASQFGAEEKDFQFEGQNVLAGAIIRKMVLKILDFDEAQVPFELLGVEADESKGYKLNTEISVAGENILVGIKGIIDRIEQKGGRIRIVDYKTGKDEKSFADIPSLFDRKLNSRNKAVLQTFIYGLLYLHAPDANRSLPVQAALYNIRDLFRADFSPIIQTGKNNVKADVPDIREFMDDFTSGLRQLLEEVFDRNEVFSQTEDHKKCSYCPYIGLCNR